MARGLNGLVIARRQLGAGIELWGVTTKKAGIERQ
jgi:hypothetical protein